MWCRKCKPDNCRPCSGPNRKTDTVVITLDSIAQEAKPFRCAAPGEGRGANGQSLSLKPKETEGESRQLVTATASREAPGSQAAASPRAPQPQPPPVLNRLKEAAREWFTQLTELTEIALEYPYEELAAATGGFSAENRLGAGAAGTVFRGQIRGRTKVAVKVLADLGGLEGFEDEVRVLSRFRHPNLVTLLGWAKQGKEKYLVYELLPGGDLQRKLQKCKEGKDPFTWAQRLRVAFGAASGLAHMMGGTPKVFHRDIKPANILLDADGTAKMADFGLAGIVQAEDQQHLSVDCISGTPGYTCPTYVLTGHVTERSEVYSFGMVLLELLVNQPPALCGPEGDLVFPLLQAVQPAAPGAHSRLLAGLDQRAGWPRPLVDELADVALACVDQESERRPLFEGIVRVLQHACRPSQKSAHGGG